MLEELERVRAYRDDCPEPDRGDGRGGASRADGGDFLQAAAPRRAATARRPVAARKLQRRRRLVLAGGLATVGVGVAGVLGLHTAAAPQSALAAQMNQLAHVAAEPGLDWDPGPRAIPLHRVAKPDRVRHDGQRQGVHRLSGCSTARSGSPPTVGSDRRDLTTVRSSPPRLTGLVCASAFNITDPASQNNSWNNRFPAGGLSLPTNDWKSLSTDPATLLKQVHQRDGGPNMPARMVRRTSPTSCARVTSRPPFAQRSIRRRR